MESAEQRYSLLRSKLTNLGFTQPLPLGSIAIVSALLDDLILTDKNLKDAKKKICELEKVTLIGCLITECHINRKCMELILN